MRKKSQQPSGVTDFKAELAPAEGPRVPTRRAVSVRPEAGKRLSPRWGPYVVVRDLIPKDLRRFIDAELRILEANRYLHHGDKQVEHASSAYGLPVSEALLEFCRPAVSKVVGAPLLPTHSFSRIYRRGAALERHTDREACEVAVSVCISARGEPWPMQLKPEGGRARAVVLSPGDALIYKGHEVQHWREPYAGPRQIQIFLFYVRAGGPHRHMKFDGRPRLGAPSERGAQYGDDKLAFLFRPVKK